MNVNPLSYYFAKYMTLNMMFGLSYGIIGILKPEMLDDIDDMVKEKNKDRGWIGKRWDELWTVISWIIAFPLFIFVMGIDNYLKYRDDVEVLKDEKRR